jgi:uncharacterized membrane protein YkvA (DUF1232 family)
MIYGTAICVSVGQHNKTQQTEQRQLLRSVNLMNWAIIDTLKRKADALKREIFALYLAARDPRTPWYAKAMAALIIAYALSPIDLIPDFIPILGYVDDLVLLPLGIVVLLKLMPQDVLADCRAKAAAGKETLPRSWTAAAFIVALWLLAAVLIGGLSLRYFMGDENWDAKFGYSLSGGKAFR